MLNLTGYEATDLIYTGTRTEVYRAIRESDRSVIIKVLRNTHPNFNELVQFRNQFIITRNLEHPNILKPLALERYGNGYALIMPDDGAISLSEYWSRSDYSLTEFFIIAIQLAEVLHYLNLKRIIHKDIKPANILIHPETHQIKLIDFSISTLLPKEQQQLINPNVLEGTLGYISPEQTGRMNRGIDYRSDFYSLGVTFYQLLTGKLPFETDDPMELIHCHIAQMPLSLDLFLDVEGNDYPETISNIIVRLMAKNAEDRYQSALGLKYDLEQCMEQLESIGQIVPFEIGKRDICSRFNIPEKLYGRKSEVSQLLAAFERVSGAETSETLIQKSLPTPSSRFPSSLPSWEGRGWVGLGVDSPSSQSELLLVAGFSGIGKTAVINEVHKPIIKQRGYFIKGKFDQFNRNIPFSAFVIAFRDLMGQLLGETDAQLTQWKTKILAAVGENGQVLIEVIPELEQIIGKQPAVPELSGNGAQNRFNLLFGKFIRVFSNKKHPLVIFIDDLQWADTASLNLMKILMGDRDINYLLILGAYRDNEVFPAHPLMLTLNELERQYDSVERKSSKERTQKEKNSIISTITLKPLDRDNINQLVAETLNCSQNLAEPLAKLIYQKTQGNPFFTTQLLKGLHDDDLIIFNAEYGYWECNLTQVSGAVLTDNVVEFMTSRLDKLSDATQEMLKLAACIGNQFDLNNLAIISEQSSEDVAVNLWEALQEGLLLPITENYKFFQKSEIDNHWYNSISASYRFLHDRVQQAAYSLIYEDRKQTIHLKIGRQLWHNLPEKQQEEQLFTIVNHLNIGGDLICDQIERYRIAQLNLQASHKAKVSIAYETCRSYCYAGQFFLAKESWKENYSLQFDLAIATIEAEYLNHNLLVAQELSQETLEKAQTLLDRIKVRELQILFEINQNKMNEAISLALNTLTLLNINLPVDPPKVRVKIASLRQEIAIPTEEIANLATVKSIQDEEKLAAIRILTNATSAAYIASPTLYPLIILQTIQHCMKYGHSFLAASAYSWYGALLCGVYDEIEAGYEFGKLSLQLLEQFNARTLTAKVINMFNVFVRPWKKHLKEAIADLPTAIQCGFDCGDVEYAFYGAVHYCNYLFYGGIPLEEVSEAQERYLPIIIKAKYEFHEGFLRINQQVVANLLGKTNEPQYLQGSVLDGKNSVSQWLASNIVFLVLCFYEAQTRIAYLFGDPIGALKAGECGWQYRQAAMGTLYVSEHHFYYSLALLANEKLDPQQSDRLAENLAALKNWAEFAPMNFQHKYDLVAAEKMRVSGDFLKVMDLYDRAIAGAKENEYTQEEALANELAAKFYLSWGKEKIAATYMTDAYYCYARWGAKAKTDQLEEKYPQLLTLVLQSTDSAIDPINLQTSTQSFGTLTSTTSVLDFASTIKASQTLSEQIELDALLSNLMQIVLENAGADKGALILNNSSNWQLVAWCDIDKTYLSNISLEKTKNVPQNIINTVKRTGKMVLINQLKEDTTFAGDPYFSQKNPNSLICTTIVHQRKIIGILYLENNLSAEAFTPDRIEVLKLLTSQAAISLENAQLYHRLEDYSHNLETQVKQRTEELQEKNQHLSQTLEQLQRTQTQLIQTEKMSSLGQMVAGIAHEINNPITFISGNINHAREYFQDLFALIDLLINFYETNSREIDADIENKLEEIDLQYLHDDLYKLFDSMQSGSDRIRNIILGLRNFSRLDEAQCKEVNIHEGLDNALMIVQHRLKANTSHPEIAIVKNYGNLPLIQCYANQLNQVFLQIITNAIDVLTISETSSNPEIAIATEMKHDKTVKISIADNGPGMSENIRQKVFDPFFSTKPVGQGTGLGLSTSYQIITEQHGGQLECISQPGVGTEFIIEIPVS